MIKTFWGKHFLGAELGLSIFLVSCLWLILLINCWEEAVLDAIKSNRAAIYALVASVAGSLLGFVLTGVAILLALADTSKLGILTTSPHYKTIYTTYMTTVRAFGLTTFIGFLCLLLENGPTPRSWAVYLTLWASILCVFRLGRCIWILEKIIGIATKGPKQPLNTEDQTQ